MFEAGALKGEHAQLSDGNSSVTFPPSKFGTCSFGPAMPPNSGVYRVELLVAAMGATSTAGPNGRVAIVSASYQANDQSPASQTGHRDAFSWAPDGGSRIGGNSLDPKFIIAPYAAGDLVALQLDSGTQKLSFFKNGSQVGREYQLHAELTGKPLRFAVGQNGGKDPVKFVCKSAGLLGAPAAASAPPMPAPPAPVPLPSVSTPSSAALKAAAESKLDPALAANDVQLLELALHDAQEAHADGAKLMEAVLKLSTLTSPPATPPPPPAVVPNPPTTVPPPSASTSAAPVPAAPPDGSVPPPPQTTPAPPSAIARSFDTSNFKRFYDAAAVPYFQHEVFVFVTDLVRGKCARSGISFDTEGRAFVKKLTEQLLDVASKAELLNEVQGLAVRLWTSAARLDNQFELCAIVNEVLRNDSEQQMLPAAGLTRAINTLCVKRGNLPQVTWPANYTTWRGGGLPNEHRPFFSPGTKYRVPMFLATSFDESTAYQFAERAADSGLPPVSKHYAHQSNHCMTPLPFRT